MRHVCRLWRDVADHAIANIGSIACANPKEVNNDMFAQLCHFSPNVRTLDLSDSLVTSDAPFSQLRQIQHITLRNARYIITLDHWHLFPN